MLVHAGHATLKHREKALCRVRIRVIANVLIGLVIDDLMPDKVHPGLPVTAMGVSHQCQIYDPHFREAMDEGSLR